MNRILETFGKPRILLPVIHAIDVSQVRRNADLAIRSGSDGVFVINQGGMSSFDVIRVAASIAALNATWTGVNILGASINEVVDTLVVVGHVSGLWSDDSEVPSARSSKWPKGLFFGGVAFKYRAPVAPKDYGAVAKTAADLGVDVVTTSGPGTGIAPDVAKVRAMREAIGDHALAVASGVTPENVTGLLPYVDAYLVATGIERRFGEFDAGRLKELADRIHGWVPR